MVLKRTLKLFTAVVLKMTDRRLGSCSTATAVWRWLIAEEAEARLVVANVLAVRRWCFGGEAVGAGVSAGENA